MAGSRNSADVRQSRGEDLRRVGLPPSSGLNLQIGQKESIRFNEFTDIQAVHPYVATQPDELSLEVADVVNVLRKMADGTQHIALDPTNLHFL